MRFDLIIMDLKVINKSIILIFTILESNYRFVSKDNMLGLTSKNYYEIILMRIPRLRDLFCDLTTNNT